MLDLSRSGLCLFEDHLGKCVTGVLACAVGNRQVIGHRLQLVVSPTSWSIKCTLGWFNHYRRLSKDYDLLPQISGAVIHVGMILWMIRHSARTVHYSTPSTGHG